MFSPLLCGQVTCGVWFFLINPLSLSLSLSHQRGWLVGVGHRARYPLVAKDVYVRNVQRKPGAGVEPAYRPVPVLLREREDRAGTEQKRATLGEDKEPADRRRWLLVWCEQISWSKAESQQIAVRWLLY